MSELFFNSQPLNLIFDLLRSDAYISVNKALMFAIGVDEAIIYAELLSRQAYFEDRGELTADGYFFNTIEDLMSATALSKYKQRIAINNLQKLELIDMKVQGIPPKRFFKSLPNFTQLANLLDDGKQKAKNARKLTDNHNWKKIEPTLVKKLHANKNNNIDTPISGGLTEFLPEHELGVLTAMGECQKKSRWRN